VGTLGAVAVAAGVLWAVGGLKETPQQPVAAQGKPIDQGRFTVTVRNARVADVKGVFDTKVTRYIVVRLHVVSNDKKTASLTVGGLNDGVAARTKAGKWIKPDEVKGTASGGQTASVQPGLPVEAEAMWKAGPADAPRQFVVGLRQWEWGPGFTQKEYAWQVDREADALAGQVTLPVGR
jgi:hypothetical protein